MAKGSKVLEMGDSVHPDYFRLKGKTAEVLVQELALKSFFTDWCFLNPVLPNGKELCDMLVIFDEVAIIWQIKDLKLDSEGKYKKPEVTKNLRQLFGARRQLFDLKAPIELENPRRGKEPFDPATIRAIYLISVLLGEGEEVFSFVENVKGHIVYVFTRDFTQIVLNELNTISDFVEYLRAKEVLISKDQSLTIFGGEQELLAYYLMNGRSFDKLKGANNIIIDQGSWEHLQTVPQYKAKKKEDKISYLWDSIIDRAHEGSAEYEVVARELARPNRFHRRYLSKVIFDAHVRAHEDDKHNLFRRMLPTKGTTYCFLFADDSEPRGGRKAMLGTICFIARGKFQENTKVIGIATEKKIRPACSYDFCLLDIPQWTTENQKIFEELQRETGIFTNPIYGYSREDEYPNLGN